MMKPSDLEDVYRALNGELSPTDGRLALARVACGLGLADGALLMVRDRLNKLLTRAPHGARLTAKLRQEIVQVVAIAEERCPFRSVPELELLLEEEAKTP